MKKTLTFRETLSVTSMLFGMFFGAGNLIFPALMGQLAGRNVWIAIIGFCVTGGRSAAAGRRRTGHQPQRRPAVA